jgi:serine/alanine adding enzyme
VTLREVAPAAWDQLLEDFRLDDVYLSRGYVESAAVVEEGRPVFLELDGAVYAAIVRNIPNADAFDVTTPYGYGGPVAAREDAGRRFWTAYDGWCNERGIVTSFFRFHPLYQNQRYAGAGVRLEPLAGTVAWRLGRGDLFGGMHRSHRNKCRKARRAGVTVTAVQAPASLDEFVALYEETMRRQRAAEFYLFVPQYWQSLAGGLRDHIVRFDARLDGKLVAAIICLASRRCLHYHLAATLDEARGIGASNLVLYEAAAWAKENAFALFHLGGGVGGQDDSLFAFKRRFDPGGVLESCIGKAVHDDSLYRALSGKSVGFDGYFPAYRVPGALSQTAGAPERTERIRPATVADVTTR